MGFNCGIVGLPNVGKSTLFNAITAVKAEVANYPFCTINPNVGIVTVPDVRLEGIERIFKPGKKVPTTIEFVDIAGLVKGASKGEGLGNQFLSHIREVDAIAHVVRCFEDPNVVHVNGRINPVDDIEIVETELILKDAETVDKKLSETEKKGKSGDKKFKHETDFYSVLRQHLLGGRLAMHFQPAHEDERVWMHDLHLLTNKPVMYVCNVHEKELGNGQNSYVRQVREISVKEGAKVVVISAEVEAEVAELPAEERKEFLESLGLEESGITKLIHEGYDMLHLLTFFTVNQKEAHAWTIPRGTKAPQAAGKVHSDFEHGFIKAEVMKYEDLMSYGSEHALKEAGHLHIQGKDYAVEDGDIMLFRYSA